MPAPNSTELVQREGRIALALDALQKGSFTSARAAAQAYDVPRTTLRRRVRNCPQCVNWFDLIWLIAINQIKSSDLSINQIKSIN